MRQNYILSSLLVIAFTFVSTCIFAQSKPIKKVLFVGNSYTYFWNLPQLVNAMAESRNLDFEARQSTHGGVNLGMHWRGEHDLESKEKIKEGTYDVVVLQDHSLRAIEYPDSLQYFGDLFCEYTKAVGARPCVYLTWARAYNPSTQDEISRQYMQLAAKNSTLVAPVGEAWALALKERPDLRLFEKDESHPSPLGSYLTACVFFSVLTEQSPLGLPHQLTTIDQNGDKLFLVLIDKEEAAFCQKIAKTIVQQLQVDQK